MQSAIGLIGLGTMGANLARNIAGRGFRVSVFNRTPGKTDAFIREHGNKNLQPQVELAPFVQSLERPHKIIVMVKAGQAVDEVMDELLPLIESGDMIIDCGNSNYHDTVRRSAMLSQKGIRFLGVGVSGGFEGALRGPSIMVGGSKEAWEATRKMFETIAAKDFSGGPTVAYFGENGAGHFVKMAHNGIEYAIMQIMAEAYDILRTLYHQTPDEIADVFSKYNKGKLQSYLFEISILVLRKNDDLAKGFLIDHIQDSAGQKGTGGWTVLDAVERGIAVPSISEAVFARTISAHREARLSISKLIPVRTIKPRLSLSKCLPLLEDAIMASVMSSFAQGCSLLHAGRRDGWHIDLAEVSRVWQGGCIIRSKFLKLQEESFAKKTNVPLMRLLRKNLPALREIVAIGARSGLPMPAMSASLQYILQMTDAASPANFIQGLRDYFGAHTYERTDREGVFHTNWL